MARQGVDESALKRLDMVAASSAQTLGWASREAVAAPTGSLHQRREERRVPSRPA